MGNMGSTCDPNYGCLAEPTYYPFGCNPSLPFLPSPGPDDPLSLSNCNVLLPANEGTLNSQGYSFEYISSYNTRSNATFCGNVPMCNKNTAIDSDWTFYYGYIEFFLVTLAIVVLCPMVGWLWSKLTRDKNYTPGGGYGMYGV
ncbi:hypothetical protein TrST_g180 [Triparma strigata]|uniref:Uncharacterized protein n=1 Tax=Triparma strigata TaxID=1606541 RepID=A0A9W7EWB9_9STRA|nr:hypothetical protein TrST_g180 [Triparma strigata]